MPNCQFTNRDDEMKSAASQYRVEQNAIDPIGLSERRRSEEYILDRSWFFSATVFWMRIEQIWVRIDHPLMQHIQNENDNLNESGA
jgi:hypothetical protein